MVTRYRATWQQEDLNEFALSHTVRYRDPLNKKRFAIPYKDAAKAQEKMAQLKRDGVKEIEITKDILRGKFKEMKKDDAYAIGMAQAKKSMNDEPPLEKDTIKKGHKIAKAIMKEAMSPAQIKKLKDEWAKIKLMSPEKVKTLKNFLDKYSTDTLMQLAQSGINFVSNMARSVASRRKTGDMKHAGSMKEDASKDAENIAKLRTRQMALQTKLKDLDVGDPKDKTPIAITKNDIENIQMKMDQIRSKTKKEEKIHPAKALIEKITAVQNKAKKTGMPYSVLKKVYNRGMAAWEGGHRPGTTPQQWAMARVNSFVTKSSGTWGGADKDLAKQVRGSKK